MPDTRDEFDEFVRSRGDRLLRLAFLLAGNRQLAEDLLQDVLVRMYVRWEHIRQTPEAYARSALTNRTISHWRWRRRHAESPVSEGDYPTIADHAGEVAGRADVLRALDTLSTRQRASIVLRYLDGLSVTDVAATLGCSEGAVKSHLARGLAKLRDVIPQNGRDVQAGVEGGSA